MNATTFRGVSTTILLVGALVVGGCNNDPGIMSAGGNGGTGKEPTPPGGGGNGGTTNGGKGGNGAPQPPGGGGGITGGGGATGAGGDKSCTAVGAMAKQLPVDVFVVLDRSGSMLNDINDDGSMGTMPTPTPGVPIKWDAMVEALTKFVNAPGASGLQLGLSVFPAMDAMMCGRRNEMCCQAAGYATPLVPVTALPGGAMAFLAGVAAKPAMMGNGTPTLPAIQGAIQYGLQREMMAGRRIAIALATDGMPNDCNSNVNNVANAAMMGANQGIFTFVIGVGKKLDNLNQIAVAGGTKAAHLVEMATADELVKAFTDVQNQAAKLACSFMIPPPPAGMTLDPSKVNVAFKAADPMKSFQIGQVGSRMACGAQGGWYYDNASNPRTVTLCEASCAQVNSSGDGGIELQFGCAGVIIK
jgi:hypothetical protein